jgi:DNA-binding NarL/FixJ family response regulator
MIPRIVRVVVADDHPLYRKGVVDALGDEPDIEVVGEAASADEAVSKSAALTPDVVLLDIAMPGGTGIGAVGEIIARIPNCRVVMLTVSEQEDDVLAALRAGAHGYLLKGVSAAELAAVVRRVAAGEAHVSAPLATLLLRDLSRGRRPELGDDLTDREREVLALVADGLTNREIGQQLYLSEKTVKHHMTNVLAKLHVRNRVEAALLASRLRTDRPPRAHL